ncbi:MAG TPA: sugar phosphate isomerase/epimerase [Catalimonadaceae bacterium]|nr:sugar phosphate isomerase/epimerase [Catalimonadaceae bacterium]
MKTIKGPAIFLAQFMGDESPFHNLDSACHYMASLGYKGVQIPSWDSRCVDLKKLATSRDYADEILGTVRSHGLEITELSTHLQGQLLAVHPAYDAQFDGFAPAEVHGNPKARQQWAEEQVRLAIQASRNLGIDRHATFSGSLLWPYLYPWPQRPEGLIDTGFQELAQRWTPLLNVADEFGVDLCYELHPGEDLHDGVTFERFLALTGHHSRANILYDPSHFVLQCLDYVSFIEHYHERIRMFHVKDAEFNPNGKAGVYGSFSSWVDRPGRFRSLGDGQINFKRIFSLLSQYDFDGWAVVEWECALKDPEQGAREGAAFVKDHIIEVTRKAFDDFAGQTDPQQDQKNKNLLGI